MLKFFEFLRKERLYLLLLLFVILVNVLVSMPREAKIKASGATVKTAEENLGLKREDMERVLASDKRLTLLLSLVSLLVLAALLLGIIVDAILFSLRIAGRSPDINTYKLKTISWNAWDVARVAILFLFFGYMVVMTESLLIRIFPLLKDDRLIEKRRIAFIQRAGERFCSNIFQVRHAPAFAIAHDRVIIHQCLEQG